MLARHWTLLKWSCLGVSAGSVVVAVALLWINSENVVSEQSPKSAVKTDQPEPQAKVEKPMIVERKGERVIWRLQAESAEQQLDGMRLTEPRLEVFTEAGEAIPIRAQEAWFEPIRKNIRFKGAVQVVYRDWVLSGEALRYDSGRDEVVVPGSFKAAKPGMTLRGRGLRADRKSQLLTVEHDVWVEDALSQAPGTQP